MKSFHLAFVLQISLLVLSSPVNDLDTAAALEADEQCASGSDCALNALQVRVSAFEDLGISKYDTAWQGLIEGDDCPSSHRLETRGGEVGGTITCAVDVEGRRHFKFPVGEFDIAKQVSVRANTVIEGNANPNHATDRARKPEPSTQTYFVATHGVSNPKISYCGTNNNLRPGEAQRLRIGFLMNSNTVVKNINFQGKDTTRPYDNGNLCGGGVFETPGCVSPGFGDGPGNGWVNKRNHCYDHRGGQNSLLIGHGKGVENVMIDSVRLNDLYLPTDERQLKHAHGSQLAVWVAQTHDGSATRNVKVTNLVSMLTRGDGINYHGNVQESVVENSHIENTGDDIYAIWGGYAANPTGIVFRNNVGKNPGVTRDYGYGVCVAIYGAKHATVSGTKCYDRRHWNSGQVPHGDHGCLHGPYCNSCLAYVHDNWFGAVYPNENTIILRDNEYLYMDAPTERITDRPGYRTDHRSNAHVVT